MSSAIERSKAISLLATWERKGVYIHALYAYQGNASFRLLCRIKSFNEKRFRLKVGDCGVAEMELANAEFEGVEPGAEHPEYSRGLHVKVPQIRESCYLYEVRDLTALNAKATKLGML